MLGQVRKLTKLMVVAALLAVGAGCQKEGSGESKGAAGGGGPAPARSSARPAENPYTVKTNAPPEAAVGEAAELAIDISAHPGFHINAEYPHNFKPAEGATGVAFEQAKYDLTGAEKKPCADSAKDACTLAAKVPFKVSAAGPQQLTGVVAFSVCNDEVCLIEKAPVTLTVAGR